MWFSEGINMSTFGASRSGTIITKLLNWRNSCTTNLCTGSRCRCVTIFGRDGGWKDDWYKGRRVLEPSKSVHVLLGVRLLNAWPLYHAVFLLYLGSYDVRSTLGETMIWGVVPSQKSNLENHGFESSDIQAPLKTFSFSRYKKFQHPARIWTLPQASPECQGAERQLQSREC
jgi:hypothetical protein